MLRRGFSLLELSVVLVIIGVITAMGVVTATGAIESARRVATERKLDALEAALMAFREHNDRLPCPAQPATASTHYDFGVEADSAGICTGGARSAVIWDATYAEGDIPVRTLGLPNEFAFDGWGRKFSYTVPQYFTSHRAFSTHHPTQKCGTSVYGGGGASDVISDGNAAYTIVSFGRNGHGAYLGNGARMSSGSAEADELRNCRCNSASPPAATAYDRTVQKSAAGDIGSATAFDDAVRYKERWQLQTETDSRYWASFVNVQAVIGYWFSDLSVDGNASVAYKKNCSGLDVNQDVGSPVAPKTVSQMSFTPDNTHLFLYSTPTGCELWKVNADTFTDVTVGALTGCPAYNAAHKALITDNGYLFMTDTSGTAKDNLSGKTIYLRMWKYDPVNAKFAAQPIAFPQRTLPVGGTWNNLAIPTHMAVSPLGEYVALGNAVATYLYRRVNGTEFVQLGPLSAVLAPSSDIRFAEAGNLLAQADTVGDVRLWRLSDNALAPLTEFPDMPDYSGLAGPVTVTALSADGGYLASAIATADATIDAMIGIYRIDSTPAGETLSAVTIDGGFDTYFPGSGIAGMAFSPDNKFLYAIERDASDSCGMLVLEQMDTLTYSYRECAANDVAGSVYQMKTLTVKHMTRQ
ncbi:Type II secretion system protein G precursor [Phycisphaerae bacterium RAS1]|nr:Type II secretion system protein G precursor [Phycisphaerae bacterium RAS1]